MVDAPSTPTLGFHPLTVQQNESGATLGPRVPDDATCADCFAPNPGWASTNLGVLLCTDCAGCHRSLGPQISRVRSVSLDRWSPELSEMVEALERRGANAEVWEACLPSWVQRPPPSNAAQPGGANEREAFVRLKYQRRDFCQMAAQALGLLEPASKPLMHAVPPNGAPA